MQKPIICGQSNAIVSGIKGIFKKTKSLCSVMDFKTFFSSQLSNLEAGEK